MRIMRKRPLVPRCLFFLLTMCVTLSVLLLVHPPDNFPPSSPITHPLSRLLPALSSRRLQARMLLVDSALHGQVCGKLIRRNITEASQLPSVQLPHPASSSDLVPDQNSSASACEDWRLQRGFDRWPVTVEELQFPLAFSFKIHKDPEMFLRLLSAVWRPQNLYCIHVDRKAPEKLYDQVVRVSQCLGNVVLPKTRIDVVHASIESLQADLECTRLALRSPIPWKYHINLCGQDFPLKTNLEMVQILRAMHGGNDIENYPPPPGFVRFSQKTIPSLHNVTLLKGSAYNSLSREFLDWTFKEQMDKDLLAWLNGSWAPDELFWATLSHSPGAPGGLRAFVRHSDNQVLSKAVIWLWDPPQCHGVYVRAVCIFGALDLPWLLSRHELLANKFSSSEDSTVVDCLERELERRAIAGFREWLHKVSWHPDIGAELLHQNLGHLTQNSHWLQPDTLKRDLETWPVIGPHWARLSNLNWTLYRSLPQFSAVTSE